MNMNILWNYFTPREIFVYFDIVETASKTRIFAWSETIDSLKVARQVNISLAKALYIQTPRSPDWAHMPPKFERPRLANTIPHYVAYKMYIFRSMCHLRMTMSHCFLFFICFQIRLMISLSPIICFRQKTLFEKLNTFMKLC